MKLLFTMGVFETGCPRLVCLVCVVLVACFLVQNAAVAADSEADSDLVFDNLEDLHSSHDAKSSQPVEESHWLSNTFHRIRRNVGKFLNSFSSSDSSNKKSRKHRQTYGDDQGQQTADYNNGVDDEYDDDDDDRDFDTFNNRSQQTFDDDEDLGNSGEGSATDDEFISSTPTRPPGTPAFFRITFILVEPFIDDFNSRESRSFQDLARSLRQEIERLYENIPGQQTAEVIQIEKRPTDAFTSKITVDLGSVNYYEENILRDQLFSHIQRTQRLGSHQVSPLEFHFRKFTGTPFPHCLSHEIPCHSGECVPASARCNGLQECQDNSDEAGCETETESTLEPDGGSGERPPEFEGTVPPVHVPSTPTTTIFPSNRTDICRADDKVRCGDHSVYICSDQECDGNPDCPGGEDELDCPGDCAENEFMCDLHRCIPLNHRCNGVEECEDGTDEHNCRPVPPTCLPSEFLCDSRCFPGTRRCDGHEDCLDGSDERNCPPPPPQPIRCTAGEYSCDDGRTCFGESQRCDGYPNCADGVDERNCPPKRCNRIEEFTCGNGQCIPISAKCNRVNDCQDQSDERNCPCLPTDFKCTNGYCVPPSQRCDGIHNCQDGSDEIGCPRPCASYQWQCSDGTCIDRMLRCNMRPDCPDRSDEIGCQECKIDEFRCNNGSCLNIAKRCDGQADCPHSEDEESCGLCANDEFKCSNGDCVGANSRCNGIEDCSDGSDESSCNGKEKIECIPEYWRCTDNLKCISMSSRCNGIFDCQDHSDEFPCNETLPPENIEGTPMTTVHCEEGEFQCAAGFCIMGYKRCNGIKDCPSGYDEEGCPQRFPEEATCAPNEFRCDDGDCIDAAFRCDKLFDCKDKSDERDCDVYEACGTRQVRCEDGVCVNGSRCDGIFDCLDSSDEQDCTFCLPGQFRCSSGNCISEYLKCDGVQDCTDGADEHDCACRPDQFQCEDSRQCISRSMQCDEYPDCTDGSDERGCAHPCRQDEFTCPTDRKCIPAVAECDGRRDCADGADEDDCPVRECPPHEFRCGEGSCIPRYLVCDGVAQCRDRSDELQCPCKDNEFQCLNGACIPNYQRCNRFADCSDRSDEQNCPTSAPSVVETTPQPVSCPVGQRPCHSATQCIRYNQWCDGRVDCYDLSDESTCAGGSDGLNLRTYPTAQDIKENLYKTDREVVFQCRDEGPLRARVHWVRGNGLALPPGSRDVNGRLEMPNIKLEHSGTYNCEALGYPPNTPGAQVSVVLRVDPYIPPAPRPPTACALHEATCSNGDCIPKHQVCDGQIHCTDGSDESRCNPHGCEPNEFRCANKRCILKTWRCDSDDDCGDGSDEANCATNPPGSPCAYHQFACRSDNQCIPKSFHCDLERDCIDGSDELGCSKPVVSRPPPPMVNLNIGDLFVVTCTAVGIPTPEVVWRLNWGHIPEKCSYTSDDGLGTLTCPAIETQDQGAYSCEAINIKGSIFAVPDTILVVNPNEPVVCPRGKFNEEARNANECIPCFCFGHSTDCRSADLFIYHFQPPFDSVKYVGVRIDPRSGVVDIREEPIYRGVQPSLRLLGRNGIEARLQSPQGELAQPNVVPYFAMPENYHGNQLKSYGGYLRYNVTYWGQGRPINAPSVILTGNGYTLLHVGQQPRQGQSTAQSVRFFVGEWVKRSETAPETLATREEIMMALATIDNILIKLQYVDGHLDTTISDIEMDSAAMPNSGFGAANYVEECRCPVGYSGTSCENCAEGYVRHRSGAWLGQCYREPEVCPSGTYGDPSRGISCEACPCPLTNPSNQFARTCSLAPDGEVTCDCPPGYVGRRCEQCAIGYTGNPLVPGDSCRPGSCSPEGSLSIRGDSQGRCQCKDYTFGASCNQCKPNTFYLSSDNQFGCIACFCMGVTKQCKSSYWYRDQISTAFTSSRNDFKLVELDKKEPPFEYGIRLDARAREIVYSNFSTRSPDVYYWSLPNRFLGDKITSYGGNLRYTLRYVPTPGGQSSRNTAPDVELVSTNQISLLYFSRDHPQPNQVQTFSVPLLEQHWQRADGLQADREHILMALADLQAIYIKATYTTNTAEAALISVSLDIADERNTGSSERALSVEQCDCPPGYKGLSCEDCDVGYARGIGGLYLGTCEPCNCNGMSNECNVETGECLNCLYPTTGEHCESCQLGYEGDPTIGIPCRYVGGRNQTCTCDDRGALSTVCDRGSQCPCKANVEGSRCDRCRSGTFGLKASNTEGCQVCFCSGVASECSESHLYIEQIPVQVIDAETSGFSLVDKHQRERITNGFQTNIAMNEIGYTFRPSNPMQWYWSLPRVFTGYRVTSYGGKLEFTHRYTQRPQANYVPDQDVIIIGNGITIYWTNPETQLPDIANKVSVELSPNANWQRLDYRQGPRPASREDILIALANIEAILVRAQLSSDTDSTYLSDITLDTAVNTQTGQSRATDVEVCRCPLGYRGTSCELCAPGYFRDPKDTSKGPLGSCNKCQCSNNERSCELGPDNRVICHCSEGFTGVACEIVGVGTTTPAPEPPPPPRPNIQVTISPSPVIEIYEVGSTVRLTCSARSTSPRPVRVSWRKEGGTLPYSAIDDGRGLLIISDVKVSDSGRYICQATDGIAIVTEEYTLTVGGNTHERPRVTINPSYLEVSTYETIDIHCRSSGTPAPVLEFKRQDGQALNPTHSFENGRFYIPRALDSDAGVYECSASNEAGYDTSTIDVRVRQVPGFHETVRITPPYYSGAVGDEFTLICESSGGGSVTQINWAKRAGQLPYNSRADRGRLTVYDAKIEDSGVYVCSIINHLGTVGQGNATVIIEAGAGVYPTTKVSPERVTISQGASLDIRCDATGTPTPIVKWTKYDDGNLGPNIQQIGTTLHFANAQVSDRGLYICVATNEHGLAQTTSMVEINRLESPTVEIHPGQSQTVTLGGSAILQCLITAGIPQPNLTWTGPNGRPLSSNIEQLAGGSLRFTQISLAESGEFICTAENEAGRTTAVGTIIVQTRPELTIIPNREVINVRQGESVKIECIGEGIPKPNVEWIKPYTDVYNLGFPEIAPRTDIVRPSAIVQLTYARTQDSGTYTCRGTNSAGTVEKRVQLVVDTLPERGDITGNRTRPGGEDAGAGGTSNEIEPYPPNGSGFRENEHVPPTTFDRDLVTPVGTRAELRCSVQEENGDQASQIVVDWIRADNSSLPEGAYVRGGVLYIENTQPEATGQYRCYGVNQAGRVLFSFGTNLKVVVPPKITLAPPRQVVRPGDHTFIHCSASGDQPITINWSAIGRPMPQSARIDNGYLQFKGIQVSDAGRYRCTATNVAGEADGVAEVYVQTSPSRPTLVAENRDQSAPIGSDVALRCKTQNSNIGVDVRWFREGQPLPANSRVNGEYLTIHKVEEGNGGRYFCEIASGQGLSTDYINLSVTGPSSRRPAIVDSPDLYITSSKELLRIGDSVDVSCQSSEPGVITAWSRPTGRFANNVQTSSGNLRIFLVRPENAGVYRCEATGYRGVYHKDYTLDIVDSNEDARDESPVEVQTEAQGSTILIKCVTDLDGNVQYAWKKLDGSLPNQVDTHSQSIQLYDIKSQDAGTYICTATNGRNSIDIPKVLIVTGIVPYFAQAPTSYIALTTLPDAYLFFSFEISFKPERGDGLILYNGHKRNEPNNDFISLSLVNAVPVFKINLGESVTTLKADRPVRLGKWHTIKVTRNRKKVTMYVDGDGPFVTTAGGRYVGLDLSEPLFIGGVPNFRDIAPEADAYKGFVGCISRFKIGHAHQDIVNEATFKEGITTCETCSENPCQNQGVCQEALSRDGYGCICPLRYSGPNCSKPRGEACSPYTCGTGRCIDTADSFDCQCPLGKAGRRCEREISVMEPAFSNDAYIAYPTPKPQRRFKMSLKVKPRDVSDGIILYVGESEEGHGDFTSLSIRNKRLEFRFDAGNGPVVVRSDKELMPNQAVVVSASKTLTEGKLIVNGNAPITERIGGSPKQLNLRTPLYVGGYDKQNIRINRGVGVNSTFNGCVSDISVSGADLSLLGSVEEAVNVEDCSSFGDENNDISSIFRQSYTENFSPSTPAFDSKRTGCSTNPCRNQGQCYPLSPIAYRCSCMNGFTGRDCEVAINLCEKIPCENGGTCNGNSTQYECDCSLGYTGTNCEQRADIRFDAEFAGRGYLEFSRALLPHDRDNEEETIALELSTNASQGLIFWHGQTPNEDGQGQDYIYLAIVGGYLEFSYDLGSGPAIIYNGKVRINDGQRHNVILKRKGQEGSIEVDHDYYEEGESLGFTNRMNCQGNIYLGGVPNISLMTGSKFTQGFNGCIHGFELQDRRRIDLGVKAISGVNVKPCYRSDDEINNIWNHGDDIVN